MAFGACLTWQPVHRGCPQHPPLCIKGPFLSSPTLLRCKWHLSELTGVNEGLQLNYRGRAGSPAGATVGTVGSLPLSREPQQVKSGPGGRARRARLPLSLLPFSSSPFVLPSPQPQSFLWHLRLQQGGQTGCLKEQSGFIDGGSLASYMAAASVQRCAPAFPGLTGASLRNSEMLTKELQEKTEFGQSLCPCLCV